MTGQLALAGLDPRTTPLRAWVAASWAALVDLLGRGVKLEHLDQMWDAFAHESADTVTEADRASWGLEPDHVAGQQALLEGGG